MGYRPPQTSLIVSWSKSHPALLRPSPFVSLPTQTLRSSRVPKLSDFSGPGTSLVTREGKKNTTRLDEVKHGLKSFITDRLGTGDEFGQVTLRTLPRSASVPRWAQSTPRKPPRKSRQIPLYLHPIILGVSTLHSFSSLASPSSSFRPPPHTMSNFDQKTEKSAADDCDVTLFKAGRDEEAVVDHVFGVVVEGAGPK